MHSWLVGLAKYTLIHLSSAGSFRQIHVYVKLLTLMSTSKYFQIDGTRPFLLQKQYLKETATNAV